MDFEQTANPEDFAGKIELLQQKFMTEAVKIDDTRVNDMEKAQQFTVLMSQYEQGIAMMPLRIKAAPNPEFDAFAHRVIAKIRYARPTPVNKVVWL